jgi:hypothetical protein
VCPAAVAQSSEAGAAIARFQAGFFDPIDQVQRIMELQARQTEHMNEIADRLEPVIRGIGVALVGNDGPAF